MRERAEAEGLRITVHTHPDSIHAGALGAALWGAYRHRVLARRQGAS
jgi:benzoyl-CoA reductase subunit D